MKLSLFPLPTLAWEAFFSNAIWDRPIIELAIWILGWNWDSIIEKKLTPTPLKKVWEGWGLIFFQFLLSKKFLRVFFLLFTVKVYTLLLFGFVDHFGIDYEYLDFFMW